GGERTPLQVVVGRPPRGQDYARADAQAGPRSQDVEGAVDDEEQSKRDSQQGDLTSAARWKGLVDDAADYESRQCLERPAGCREEQGPHQPCPIRLGKAPGATKHGGVKGEAA